MTSTASKRIGCVLASLLVAGVAFGEPAGDPYAEVLQYKFDQPRTAIMAIEAQIRAASPADLRTIEAKLLTVLQTPAATKDCREWVCRQLRQAGSERSASALAALLSDKDLGTVARLALQSIPGPQVDAALRDALPKLPGEFQAGVIQTIGARGDRAAVPLLAPLASDRNLAVAEAALYALGRIGSLEALRSAQNAQVPDGLKRYRAHTLLLCAERLVADGQTAEAALVYGQVWQDSDDAVLKSGALRGLVFADKARAAAAVSPALRSKNPRVRLAAAKLVCEAGDAALWKPVLAELGTLPADVQVSILSTACDAGALPAAITAAKSSDDEVRAAALAALGRLGDHAVLPLLLAAAASGSGAVQANARRSVQILRGAETDAALLKSVPAGAVTIRAEAIRGLAARGTIAAVPLLLEAAANREATVRAEAFAALGALADTRSVPALVALLVKAPADDVRGAAEQAVIAAGRRLGDKDAVAASVVGGLSGQNPAVRAALLRVAATIPGGRSLAALRTAVQDADPGVKETAVRGLAAWPDAAAAPDLLAIARGDGSQVHRVLALRGVIRLAAAPGVRPAAEAVQLLADALKLCGRADEKKLVLAALADVKNAAALDVAGSCLADKETEVEAATAVVKIARALQRSQPDVAAAAVRKVLDVCKLPAARQVAESSLIVLDQLTNIAPQGTATSPDGLEKDGTASGDQAAIDGDPGTYWDEEDGRELYRLVVTFKQPEKIAAISITGYAHHRFAPKDFQVLVNDKVVRDVKGAQYDDNLLLIKMDEVTGQTVELRITGYYGGSPAIRELGIYRPAGRK